MSIGVGDKRGRFLAALFGMAFAATAAVSHGAIAAEDDDDNGTGSWSDHIADKVKDAMTGAGKKLGLGKPPPPPPSEAPSGCPTIALLPGTEVQRVMAPGASDNQGVRYQFTLSNVGRECAVSGDRVSFKVGADGRVLLGPAGAAGRFDVPIRVAVFSETQQKPVESKLFRVPVSIAPGQDAAPFAFASDRMTLSVPRGRANEYSIKVGIDAGAGGGGGGPAVKTRHARRHKPAATQAAESTASQ